VCFISDFYVNLRVEVAAVSRNRYGVEKTVDTHEILINAIKVCLSSRNMITVTRDPGWHVPAVFLIMLLNNVFMFALFIFYKVI
jgi:hypothetical protein